ncbi:hypothetical protein O4J56_22520 [Nocardiopsis sp. RSe5-2]|uniref:Uncharacterized protein n=1 Tax=Nocardiopsis endophytica TaxID=3018445 RepID=A0ABT4U908_9ACTN|nr:hypothetical protein [Nocardiopsis endophytica]MDA2813438.1 hypothetical protein [Nocardiopsis endophytica]
MPRPDHVPSPRRRPLGRSGRSNGSSRRTRMRLLALLAALPLLAACASDADGPSADDPSAPSAPALPEVQPYRVAEGEPAPDVKRAAVRFLEAVLNYGPGEGTAEAARDRLREAGAGDGAGAAVTDGLSLLDADASAAAQVVYPQLGGLTEDRASIMAVVRTSVLSGAGLTSTTRVVDVRLARGGGAWEVEEVASAGDPPGGSGGPSDASGPPSPDAAGPGASPVAAEVLASERITLPDSARGDITSGRIDERVLRMMLDLAFEAPISVAVLATGHPDNVFGSSSVSNHTQGRAVDIWAVDGATVSDQRLVGERGPVRTLMELALEKGATEVGGPWALSTPDGAAFTDTVHEDHLHIGFKT